ncbi:ABC transporter permease [Spirosoma gilvum]
MLLNYIKIALRNLWKAKVFTAINVAGLAMGIAAFVLILEYISFEKSYNQFHANLPHLYRVLLQDGPSGTPESYAPSAVAPALKQNFADVDAVCRLAEVHKGIVTFSEKANSLRSFKEENVLTADGDFFRMFSFPIVAGSPLLNQPNTVAISATKARAYFGKANAVGKVLTLNNQFGKTLYTITGVFADVPANSDLQFDMVYSLSTLETPAGRNGNDWARLDAWQGAFSQTIVQLKPQANLASFEQNAQQLIRKARPTSKDVFSLQPLRYVHLGAGLGDNRPTEAKLGFIYLIGGVALLILTIAWLNYINLSTAGAMKRSKEVGVRKVVGANRGQIISQFLSESLLLNLLALLIAFGLISLLQQPFNSLIGKDLSLAVFQENQFWIVGLGAVVIGALVSGSYAAFVLSGFSILNALKSSKGKSGRGSLSFTTSIRQGLVVFQFAISILLMVATVILYRQLSFMKNQDLGMNIKQLLVIKGPEVGEEEARRAGRTAFRNEIARLPYVETYCNSGSVPGGFYNFNADGITRQNPVPGDEKKSYAITYADDRFLPTYDIKLAAGQNFTPDMCDKGMKALRVLINEKAVKSLGFASAKAAVGQKVKFGEAFEIVGVLNDYHHESLQRAIQPLIIFPGYPGSNYTLRLSTDQIQAKIGDLDKLYKQIFPGNPFEYFFVDEQYDKQYKAEQQYGQIFITAAALAILIACLGLFGLTTFMAEQRTKEIGVRKVLGASVSSLVTLLSKDFLKLVLIALIIATPLAWYAANRWLEDFAYRTTVDWWIFALAGTLAILIAFVTVSFQSIKAALVNPVKSLRSE